jgi:hypothetical protein
MLGAGKPLFKDIQKTTVKLVASKPMSSGVILLTYQKK